MMSEYQEPTIGQRLGLKDWYHKLGRIIVGILAGAGVGGYKANDIAQKKLYEYNALDVRAYDCLPEVPKVEGFFANLRGLAKLGEIYTGDPLGTGTRVQECIAEGYMEEQTGAVSSGVQGVGTELGEAASSLLEGDVNGLVENLRQAGEAITGTAEQMTQTEPPWETIERIFNQGYQIANPTQMIGDAAKFACAGFIAAQLLYTAIPVIQYVRLRADDLRYNGW